MKAMLDKTNVSTNWIESVFDSSLRNNNVFVGFIGNSSVIARVNGNTIEWTIYTEVISDKGIYVAEELKKRLKECECEDDIVYSTIKENGYLGGGYVIYQNFYFKEDRK